MLSPNALELRDDLNETSEALDFPKSDEVLLISFAFGHLLAASQSHCFVYRENTKSGWASGMVSVELRERCPQFIRQADKYFLVMDGGVLYAFAYDGALLGTPGKSWPSSDGRQRMASLTWRHVSAAREAVAIRSPSDPRIVHCLHYRTGKVMYSSGDGGNARPLLTHGSAVVQIELDPCSPTAGDQLLAFLDAGRDLHLLPLPSGYNKIRSAIKIGTTWFRLFFPTHQKDFWRMFSSGRCDIFLLEFRLLHAGLYQGRRRAVRCAVPAGRAQRCLTTGSLHHPSKHSVCAFGLNQMLMKLLLLLLLYIINWWIASSSLCHAKILAQSIDYFWAIGKMSPTQKKTNFGGNSNLMTHLMQSFLLPSFA